MGYNLYWGEMHTHNYCGGGVFGEIEQAVEIAKSHLDFWASAEHNNLNDEEFHPFFDWPRIKKVIKENNEPGKFVTFAGFEYGSMRGDYNCYFADDDSPDELPRDVLYLEPLKEFAASFGGRAMLIPHHTGYKVGARGTDWDERVMALAEIFSMHGSSEREPGPFPMTLWWMGPREGGGTVQAGLARGKRIGFIASSDGHAGYPGCYRMGLVAAYATELTRKALWEALWARRTYAVTGDRIELEFSVDGHIMGSAYTNPGPRRLKVKVKGDDLLDQVELVKNNRVLHRTHAVLNHRFKALGEDTYKVKIEAGWHTPFEWNLHLEVEGGEILHAEPQFGPPWPNRITALSPQSCTWIANTVGSQLPDWHTNRNGREGTQAVVFELRGTPATRLRLTANGVEYVYSLADLKESHLELQHDPAGKAWAGQKIKFHRAIPSEQYTCSFDFVDEAPELEEDWYYLRVTQANGQMAWSSPVWVKR